MTKVWLASFKAEHGNFWDKLIALRDFSNFSHTELVIGENPETATWYTSHAKEGGVCFRKINYRKEEWDLILLPDFDYLYAIEWFKKHINCGYDWKAIFLYEFLPFKTHDRSSFYCSEAVAEASRLIGKRQIRPAKARDLIGIKKLYRRA